MLAALQSEDILVLLKLAVWKNHDWTVELLSEELGMEKAELVHSLRRLEHVSLIDENTKEIHLTHTKEFILFALSYIFPASLGPLTRGTLIGGRTDPFLISQSKNMSLWVWPNENGLHQGYAIEPLSPKCTFAALNDSKLKTFLSIADTIRVMGKEARSWAGEQLEVLL